MKNLLLLVFTLSSISLFGQLEYAASLGPNLNLHSNGSRTNIAPFSSFANFGVKYPMSFIKLTGHIEWSISNWYIFSNDDEFFFTELYLQTDHIKILPGIEINIGKYLTINSQVYASARMNETYRENSFFFGFGPLPPVQDEPNLTQFIDVGIHYGGKINFSKKVAFTLNIVRGSINVLKKSATSLNGSLPQNGILKNRNIQLGIEFNLSEYY